MLQVQTSEFKYKFPYYLKMVEEGQSIMLVYGKQKKMVAMVVPPKLAKKPKRKLGSLSKYGTVKFKDFDITDEELLNL